MKSNSSSSESREQSDFTVFRNVLYYCFLIIALPVVTFFFCKFILFDVIFGKSDIPSNVYSAIASIIALHLALALYIYKAYSEPTKPPSKSD